MEAGGHSESPAQGARTAAEISSRLSRLTKRHALRARDVQLYRLCEDLTGPLIYFMVVVGPWAFGTTQSWSIWLMNGAGYLLGLLLAGKLAIRWFKGYEPPRWGEGQGAEVQSPEGGGRRRGRVTAAGFTAILAGLTVAILGYCLVSAVNVRATANLTDRSFTYRKVFIHWLPHSFDSSRTWLAFWTYLGLAFSFWAVRDWLLGKTEDEARAEYRKPQRGGGRSGLLLPARLRRLLWVLALNGGLLGLEGIVQRLEGSGRLLFLVKPRVNPGADTQFGPYAYRANASQYFNLLWPVCLGFWWTLNRSLGFRRNAYHLILVCCVVMAACPIISTSRAGALVMIGIVVLAAFFLSVTHFLLAAHRQEDGRTRRITLACLLLFFAGALTLGFGLVWKTLKPRMAQLNEGFDTREAMYDAARPMAADYPLFGTGPGTFEPVFQLYLHSTDTYWPAQLHNDWLETRITFGWFGSALIALAFVAVLLRWFARGGIHGGRRFVILIWLALAGCLVHARYDFPFQIHSIVLLFLVVCAILMSLTRRP
jgi:NADH:ubiquinone oxidoreductase subunit 6 (subunit J)